MPLSQPWQQCLTAFLQMSYDRSGSESTRAHYRANLLRFFETRSPETASRADVLAFLQEPSRSRRNRGEQVSASTKNHRLSSLVSFYRFASLYEVDGVPLYDKAPPTTGIPYLKPAIAYHDMSADELARFFAAIPDTVKGCRDRALFLTYFWTARRRNEINRLTWGDIEPAIIVEPDGSRRHGYTYSYHPKGRSRETRMAELPTPAYSAILRYLERARRLGTIAPDDFIFTAIDPRWGNPVPKARPLNHNYVNFTFKSYCRAAGLSDRFTLHSLRHTAARLRYEAGSDVRSVQAVLGHSSLATTDLYLRRLSPLSDTGARLLEARFAHLSGVR